MNKEEIKRKFGFNVLKQFNINPEVVDSITHNKAGCYTIETTDVMDVEPFDVEAAERGASIIRWSGNTKEWVSGFEYISGKPNFKEAAIIVDGHQYTIEGVDYKGDTVLFMRKGYSINLELGKSLLVSNDKLKWSEACFIFESPGGIIYCVINDIDNRINFINYKDSQTQIENKDAFIIHPFKFYRQINY